MFRKIKVVLILFVLNLSILGLSLPIAHAQVPPAGSIGVFCLLLNLSCVGGGGTQSEMKNIAKSALPGELRGSDTDSDVSIYFDVLGGSGISNVTIFERLAPQFTFISSPPFSTNIPTGVNVTNLNSNQVDLSISTIPPGTYWIRFPVVINSNAPEGNTAIDNVSGNPATDCNDGSFAHATYTDGSSATRCEKLPAGNINRIYPKVVFHADSWIGNKSVTAGRDFQIGANTLVISGLTTSQGISNYNLPTTGKLAWQRIEDLMRSRTDRNVRTQTAILVPKSKCPTQDVSQIYLDSGSNSPFENINRQAGTKKVWVLDKCNFTIRNAQFYGTGSIVNIDLNGGKTINSYNGGLVNIYGSLEPVNPTDTIGYISFRNSGNGSEGQVNLQGDAEVKNMAIFTSGVVEMGGNNTGGVIVREMQLVSRYMRFPPLNQMKNDIFFERSIPVVKNIPPLFDEFTLPTGSEVP